ncbi:MAG: helix-turn-helix transcriptional regulator [Acidithiobacillus sp.]
MALTPTPNAYHAARRERDFHKDFYYDDGLGWLAHKRKIVQPAICSIAPATAHRTGNRTSQEGVRSSAASGDGNSDDSDSDEPERRTQQPLQLYDQASLAAFLCISKKTLQNRYSVTPHLLPQSIHIPGARGPRWTANAVQAWLESRPAHTRKPVVIAPKNKVGRPRIAACGKGGAA